MSQSPKNLRTDGRMDGSTNGRTDRLTDPILQDPSGQSRGFNNCLFGAINIVKNRDQEKYDYSGYGITFASAG